MTPKQKFQVKQSQERFYARQERNALRLGGRAVAFLAYAKKMRILRDIHEEIAAKKLAFQQAIA